MGKSLSIRTEAMFCEAIRRSSTPAPSRICSQLPTPSLPIGRLSVCLSSSWVISIGFSSMLAKIVVDGFDVLAGRDSCCR